MSGVFTLGFLSFSLSLFTSFSDGQSKAQIEEFRQKLRDMKGMLQKIRQSDDQEKSKDMTYVSVADAEEFFSLSFHVSVSFHFFILFASSPKCASSFPLLPHSMS